MTWNYRLLDIDGKVALHEVYYDDYGKPEMYTESSTTVVDVCLHAVPLQELFITVAMIDDAIARTILTKEDFNHE